MALTVGKLRKFLEQVEEERKVKGHDLLEPFEEEEIEFHSKGRKYLARLKIEDGPNGLLITPINGK